MNPPEYLKNRINISDFDYALPDERIAKFPLKERDASKLLLLREAGISEDIFRNIQNYLPADSLLVFNETKVVQARMIFRKETGAKIEIFCLEPAGPKNDFQLAFQQTQSVEWKCLVGNSKRWKSGKLKMQIPLVEKVYELYAVRIRQDEEYSVIRFNWKPEQLSFAEVLELGGQVPIPPYLNREPVPEDRERYQSIFARSIGSVAAPTASLHFTEAVMKEIQQKGIETSRVTLHVGAGTFKPVIAKDVSAHVMHYEQISINQAALLKLTEHLETGIIAVGTTSVRTLESLYWHGLKLMHNKTADPVINISQWEPYQYDPAKLPAGRKVLAFLLDYMERNNLKQLSGSTQLMILPGYTFKIIRGMLTNFHQPKSTLLLLVSALIGQEWKKAYDFALKNDFRFLSYGDSCLFLPK